jgi:hypothetical protein
MSKRNKGNGQNGKSKQKDSFALTMTKNLLGTGLKYLDTPINSGGGDLVISSTGVALMPSACIVPTGTLQTNRVGKRIFVVKMDYRFGFTMGYQTNVNTSQSTLKVIAVRDDQTKGTGASFSEVFVANDIRSGLNPTNMSRFRVLKNINECLNSGLFWNSSTSQSIRWPVSVVHVGTVKVNDYVEYASTDTTGAVASTVRGAISWFAVTDNGLVTAIDVNCLTRIWFYDAS